MKKTQDFQVKVSNQVSPLKNYAVKLTRDQEEAEDLVQDTMLKAFTNADKFLEGTNLKGWLYTMMKNIFINKYRRAMKSKIFNDFTENQHYLNSAVSDQKNGGEEKLLLNDINVALYELSDNLRNPFLLSYQGYKYEEISMHLKIPLGTVKVRIHNARKVLMLKLDAYKYN